MLDMLVDIAAGLGHLPVKLSGGLSEGQGIVANEGFIVRQVGKHFGLQMNGNVVLATRELAAENAQLFRKGDVCLGMNGGGR